MLVEPSIHPSTTGRSRVRDSVRAGAHPRDEGHQLWSGIVRFRLDPRLRPVVDEVVVSDYR